MKNCKIVAKRYSYSIFKKDMGIPNPMHVSSIVYQENQQTFDFICEHLGETHIGDRAPLLALHATPGLGKSALLDRLASLITDWRTSPQANRPKALCKAPPWLRDLLVISVTFNLHSGVQGYNNNNLKTVYRF